MIGDRDDDRRVAENEPCAICGSTERTRYYMIAADGVPLDIFPIHLCGEHGTSFLLRCGCAFGEMMKEEAARRAR